MLPPDCRCYLLNLDRSPERLAHMHAQLTQLGIDYERVPGVDGMALDEATFREHTRENRYYKPIRRGEVGCQLGHLKALQYFVDSGARYALILEDDAELDPELAPATTLALTLREHTANPLLQWDVLKLTQRRRHSRYIELAQLNPSPSGRGDGMRARHLVEYGLSVPSTTTAALWTRAGAARWIAAYRGTARPIDCDLQHPWEYGLNILSLHPPLAATADSPTTMDSPNRTTRRPWSKLRYELARIWPRLRHFGGRYGWGVLLVWLWRRHLVYRGARR